MAWAFHCLSWGMLASWAAFHRAAVVPCTHMRADYVLMYRHMGTRAVALQFNCQLYSIYPIDTRTLGHVMLMVPT